MITGEMVRILKDAEKPGKVRTHLRENRKVYLAIGAGVALGVAGTILTGRNEHNTEVVQKIQQIAWRPSNSQVVIRITERSTPSKPVHLVGTNLYFDSLHDAARKTGHHLSMLSKHVNGHIPDLNGDVFEVLKPA